MYSVTGEEKEGCSNTNKRFRASRCMRVFVYTCIYTCIHTYISALSPNSLPWIYCIYIQCFFFNLEEWPRALEVNHMMLSLTHIHKQTHTHAHSSQKQKLWFPGEGDWAMCVIDFICFHCLSVSLFCFSAMSFQRFRTHTKAYKLLTPAQ